MLHELEKGGGWRQTQHLAVCDEQIRRRNKLSVCRAQAVSSILKWREEVRRQG